MKDIIETTAVERTPEIIAREINTIKEVARKSTLAYAIEIGQRLTEVKEMLPYGSWGQWLADNVNYSVSTASNLMKLYREYGNRQISMTTEALSQALEDLDMTSALLLTALPPDERADFVEQNDVSELSTRELEAAIKAKKDSERASAEAKEAEEALQEEIKAQKIKEDLLNEEIENLKKELSAAKRAAQEAATGQTQDVKKQVSEAKKQAAEAEKKKNAAEIDRLAKKALDLEKKLKDTENAKIRMRADYEAKIGELKRAEAQAAISSDPDMVKFQALLPQLQDTYNRLSSIAANAANPETRDKLKAALKKVLEKLNAAN